MGLAETINKVGPGILEGRLESIANIAVQVLDGKAMCQQDPDQDEDEEAPEDTAEYDSILVSAAGDLVAALANALGAWVGGLVITAGYGYRAPALVGAALSVGGLLVLGLSLALQRRAPAAAPAGATRG